MKLHQKITQVLLKLMQGMIFFLYLSSIISSCNVCRIPVCACFFFQIFKVLKVLIIFVLEDSSAINNNYLQIYIKKFICHFPNFGFIFQNTQKEEIIPKYVHVCQYTLKQVVLSLKIGSLHRTIIKVHTGLTFSVFKLLMNRMSKIRLNILSSHKYVHVILA